MRIVQFDATAWRTILPAGLRQRRNRFGATAGYFFLGSLLLFPSIVVALAPRGARLWPLGLGTFGFIAAIYLFALWMLVVAHVVTQNIPFAARLVPGHTARLRDALLQAWGALVFVACGIGAVFGVPLVAAVGVSIALVIVAILIGLTANISVLTVVVFCALSPAVGRFVQHGFEAGWAMSPSAVAALALGLSAASLMALVRSGGRAGYVGPVRRAQTIVGKLARHWIGRLHLRNGMRDSRAGSSTFRPQSSPVSRLLRGFEPTIRWRLPLVVLIPPLLFDLASMQFGELPDWSSGLFVLATVVLSILVVGAGLGTFDVPIRRRSDQALLALLPGLPRGVDLSRAFAFRLTAYWMVSWGCISLAWLCLAEGPIAGHGFVSWTACTAIGVIPVLPMAWRRWAIEPSRGSDFRARFLALIASAAAAFGLVVVLKVDLLQVASTYLAIAVIGCAWGGSGWLTTPSHSR